MAIIQTRGYINKYETKTSAGGKEYVKFTLAVQQKRKDRGQEVVEKLYLTCVDFSGKEIPGLHTSDRGELTAYVGITGYLTVTGWCKDGKGGANLDVTVTEYEAGLEQRGGGAAAGKPAPAASAAPEDPFAI
jgi:hypothetical protein